MRLTSIAITLLTLVCEFILAVPQVSHSHDSLSLHAWPGFIHVHHPREVAEAPAPRKRSTPERLDRPKRDMKERFLPHSTSPFMVGTIQYRFLGCSVSTSGAATTIQGKDNAEAVFKCATAAKGVPFLIARTGDGESYACVINGSPTGPPEVCNQTNYGFFVPSGYVDDKE